MVRAETELDDSDELLTYNTEDPNYAKYAQMMQMLANAADKSRELVLPILKSCCSLWVRVRCSPNLSNSKERHVLFRGYRDVQRHQRSSLPLRSV